MDTKGILRSLIGKKAAFSLVKGIDDDKVYVRHTLTEKGKISTEVHELASKELRNWIFYVCEGSVALKEISARQKEAVAVSAFDKTIKEVQVAKRVAYNDEEKSIYLCLHDEGHHVVKVSSDGWKVIKERKAPVVFLRSGNTKALPVPVEGGDLKNLQHFVNVNDDDLSLIIGWLLTTFYSSIDCPILHMEAPKGSGKTTATRFLKELVDPDTTGVIAPFRTYKDLCTAASHVHLLALDNLSGFSKKESDELCRAVTGAGHLDRKLFTDGKLHTSVLHNPFITNGINFGELQPDLRDRCYSIKLRPLDGASRKSQDELNREFEAEKPKLLGAILDALVNALGNGDYEPEIDTRLLDAGKFIMRAAAHNNSHLPFSAEKFKEVLTESKKQEEISYALDNPIACAIYYMAQEAKDKSDTKGDIPVWEGTTSKLLLAVKSKAKEIGIGKNILKSPVSLGKKMREVSELLKPYDIEINNEGHNYKGSKFTITYLTSREAVEGEVEEAKTQAVEN